MPLSGVDLVKVLCDVLHLRCGCAHFLAVRYDHVHKLVQVVLHPAGTSWHLHTVFSCSSGGCTNAVIIHFGNNVTVRPPHATRTAVRSLGGPMATFSVRGASERLPACPCRQKAAEAYGQELEPKSKSGKNPNTHHVNTWVPRFVPGIHQTAQPKN